MVDRFRGGFESVPLPVTLGLLLLQPSDLGVGVGQQRREPFWARAPRRGVRRCWLVVSSLLGEGVPLRHRGDVGSVDGDDAFKKIACLGDVVALGDDADHVRVAGPGSGDVQAPLVVAGEVRAIAVSTVSDCQPCSVAA